MFEDLSLVLNFRINPFSLFSLLAIVVNLIILYLVQRRGVKNETNRLFMLVPALIVWWGVSEFLDRSSLNPTGSLFWDFFGRPSWVFLGPVLISFTLSFVGKGEVLKNRFYQIFILGTAFIFLFLMWNTNLILNNNVFDNHPIYWGWRVTPLGEYLNLFLVWFEIILLVSLGFLINYYQRIKDPIRKKQTLFIITAILIPVIGGSISDVVLPLFNIQVLPVAILLATGMSISISYTIIRSNLFVMNPTLTANTIIENMSESLLVIGADNVIDEANQSLLSLLGYKRNNLLGQSVKSLFPDGESWDKFSGGVLNPLRKRGIIRNFETVFKTKNGQEIPVSFSAVSLIDAGRLTNIVGLAWDISEIKSLVTNLTAERNKMNVALSGVFDGVFAVDKLGRFILFNPAMEKLTGYSSDEVTGEAADEALFMYTGDKRISMNDLLPAQLTLKDHVIAAKENVRLVKKDGSSVYANIISSSIAEGDQVNLGAIVTVHNITKEHELEEMKLDFVAMAAHELRTPLTSIRGYLSILQEEIHSKLTKQEFSFLQRAFNSSSNLAALVENLLSVSNIEKGTMTLDKNEADWEHLVVSIVNTYKTQAKEKDVDLSFEGMSRLPKIYIDEFRIREVLANLIANAITYTKKGGRIKVHSWKKGSNIITSVEDSGQGIPKNALPKLFTKFFRVSGVLEQGSKGTGLGLYIAKSIVEMHKGKIWVESKLGKGSTFYFSVPATKPKGEKKHKTPVGYFKNRGLILPPKKEVGRRLFTKK